MNYFVDVDDSRDDGVPSTAMFTETAMSTETAM